jgi:Rod binding domain-containing protein
VTGTGIGPIDQSLLPADVRNGTPADRKRYEAALGFERMLVAQLTQQLADTAKPADDGGESGATSAYRSMLPGAMADAITQGGGLGLARTIADDLKRSGA